MEQSELLRHVVGVLEKLGLRYLVTGSVVTIFFGEPRVTNDIDIVVDLPEERIKAFFEEFPEDEFYLSEVAIREAVKASGQFNIIHPASGLKVDVMIPQDTPFDRSRFARSIRVKPAEDFDASFSSIEDVIIKKMEYYREGGAEKHLRDITGVLKVSGQCVDREYVHDWAARLGLLDIWRAVQGRVDSKNRQDGPSHDGEQR